MLSALSPTPQGVAARFGVGRRNAWQFRLASRSGRENLRNFRIPLVLKATFSVVLATSSTFLHFWAMFGQNIGLRHISSQKKWAVWWNMSNLVPGALFPGFGCGALHLQSQRKCQVRMNRARISVPNESGGSGERLGGKGNPKMEQRGPSPKHPARVLAVRLPRQYISPVVSSNSSKEIASPNVWDRHERLERGNQRSRFKRTYFN